MKINFLLTFDYELPLGGIKKSFSHALFNPTDTLLKFAEAINIPIVLFADILSYIKFSNENITNYTIPFKNQIHEALRNGNDIQLHIHPHWIESEISEFNFKPSNKYKLSDFNTNSKINEIIVAGITELCSICKMIKPDYSCVSYRGGGYNLHPSSKEIFSSLIKNNILFDSSIAQGFYFTSEINHVDYRKVPVLPNWFINQDGDYNSNHNNGIYEIPIASIPKSIFEIPTTLKLNKLQFRSPENRGIMIYEKHRKTFLQKVNCLLSNRMLTVDNYTYSFDYLKKIFNYHVNKYSKFKEISFCLIGHPKAMGNYSFELLENLIVFLRKEYKNEINFTTYNDLQYLNNKQGGL